MVSHGFREGAKAMCKTARGCHVRRRFANEQRLAILPWPPGLSGPTGEQFAPSQYRQRFSLPDEGRISLERSALKRADNAARTTASAANAELADQRLVTGLVGTIEVVEKLTPLGHKLEQATPGMVVLDVTLEVLSQIVDAFRQDRDLHFGRPGVARFGPISLDEFRFTRGRDRHRVSFVLGFTICGQAGMSSSEVATWRGLALKFELNWLAPRRDIGTRRKVKAGLPSAPR
jgi:hypothetical protein